MKVLIRNSAQEYLTASRTWTREESQAIAFASGFEAVFYSKMPDAPDLALAYRFNEPGYDFESPLQTRPRPQRT